MGEFAEAASGIKNGAYPHGCVRRHDLDNLIPILEDIRDRDGNDPVLLHIKTEKGRPQARGPLTSAGWLKSAFPENLNATDLVHLKRPAIIRTDR